MKTHRLLYLFLILSVGSVQAISWTQKANLSPGNRYGAFGFSIGSYGYIGSGTVQTGSTYTLVNDLWQYNPANDSWSQMATLPASGRIGAASFTVLNKGFITTGYNFTSYLDDCWQYEPTSNSWIQKTSFPGGSRYSCASFAVNEYGFVGMGKSVGYYSDFYRYDVQADSWSMVTSVPGIARQSAKGFTIDGYGFIVGGAEEVSAYNCFETYRYDPIGDNWSQMTDYPGSGSHGLACFVLNDIAYVGTGTTISASNSVFNDLWSYDANTNAWSAVTVFTGGNRQGTVSMAIGNKGYMGLGSSVIFPALNYYSDWWSFDSTTGIGEEEDEISVITAYIDPGQQLHVELPENATGDQTFNLFNAAGQLVRSVELHSHEKELILDLSTYARGVYQCALTGGPRQWSVKIAYVN